MQKQTIDIRIERFESAVVDAITSTMDSQQFELSQINNRNSTIIAITRGGLITAQYLSYFLNLKNIKTVNIESYNDRLKMKYRKPTIDQDQIKYFINSETKNYFICDDLVATGDTIIAIIDGILNQLQITSLLEETKDTIQFFIYVPFADEQGIKMINETCDSLFKKTELPFTFKHSIFYSEKIDKKTWLIFPWDNIVANLKESI